MPTHLLIEGAASDMPSRTASNLSDRAARVSPSDTRSKGGLGPLRGPVRPDHPWLPANRSQATGRHGGGNANGRLGPGPPARSASSHDAIRRQRRPAHGSLAVRLFLSIAWLTTRLRPRLSRLDCGTTRCVRRRRGPDRAAGPGEKPRRPTDHIATRTSSGSAAAPLVDCASSSGAVATACASLAYSFLPRPESISSEAITTSVFQCRTPASSSH